LDHAVITYPAENREEKRDVLNDKLIGIDINTVGNVKGMLNEKKYARTQDFLSRDRENE